MTMVKVTAFAQYPTTKVINGVKVVIMTVPQAEQIDNKFIRFTDSINYLNKKLESEAQMRSELNAKLRDINNKPTPVCMDTLGLGRQLLNANYEINSLKMEIDRIKNLEYVDRRTRISAYVGLTSILALWIVSFVMQ